MGDSLTFDLVAANWRAASKDQHIFLPVLANKLQKALPHIVEVDFYFSLTNKMKVKSIVIDCENFKYRLHSTKAGKIKAEIGNNVRGIVLKTEIVTFEEWLDHLTNSLAENDHSSSSKAIQEFLL